MVDFPDVEAIFNGGETAMRKWMQENLLFLIFSHAPSRQRFFSVYTTILGKQL